METTRRTTSFSTPTASKTSLEGWKPASTESWHGGQQCLKNFLRGMETRLEALASCLTGYLKNFLRGMETP